MSALAAFPNLLALLIDRADRLGDQPFLWRKQGDAYRPMSWRAVASSVSAVARGLIALGLQPGDRVVLVGENRPEWLISDLAVLAAGGVTVPAYVTNGVADHRHILTHSGAVGAIVSTSALAQPLVAAAAAAPELRWLATMTDAPVETPAGVAAHLWADLAATDGPPDGAGAAQETDPLAAQAERLTRADLAGLIYTSGTGGAPKGVMLTHGSALANCAGAWALLEPFGLKDEVFLSFLPASHAYERTLGQFLPIALEAQIYYGEGIEHLARNIAEAKPTLLACVPRMLDAMRQRIERTVARDGGMKAKLFQDAHRLGRARREGTLGLLDRPYDALLEALVREKFRGRFGGRVKAMVSAGAALNPDVGAFFTALGLTVLQGYGQTEAGPMISGNTPDRPNMASVGRPIDTVAVRIADDGEILVRGEGVMRGYWRDEAATAAAIRDGWLHTGDIGHLDADGHLHITDRKKDIIVLSGGDNVSPARVEGVLCEQEAVMQAAVFGDDFQAGLTAVLVPDPDWVKGLADAAPETIRAGLGQAVDAANRSLGAFERVRGFIVADEPFSLANAQLTPTMKVRRHQVRAAYADRLRGGAGR